MFTTNLIKNALGHARNLQQKSIYVSASQDSILGELVDTSLPTVSNDPTAIKETNTTIAPGGKLNSYDNFFYSDEDTFASIVASTTVSYGEETMHSLRIKAIVDDLAPLVTAHISHARNVVVPLITDFETAAHTFLDMAKGVNPAADFTIQPGVVPGILFDESFTAQGLDSIHNLAEKTNNGDTKALRLSIQENEIADLIPQILNQGNDRLNSMLADWLKKAPYDLIHRVFVVNFTANTSSSSDVDYQGKACQGYDYYDDYCFRSYGLRRGDYFKAVNIGLATYLIASWLVENVQKTTESSSLENYTKYFKELAEDAGVITKFALKQITSQVESGILVSSLLPSKKTVVVNDSVYRDWLTKGGQPEALLGLLVSSATIYSADTILEQKEKLINSWNSYIAFRSTNDLVKLKTDFRAWCQAYMQNSLNNLTEGEQEVLKSNANLKFDIMKHVEEEIEKLTHTLHNDIAHTALHLVAKGRFFYTSAYSILGEMQQYYRANPDIDPREAATLSAIAYLVEYFDAQICIQDTWKK